MQISFEFVPEYYEGEYPYAIIRIKKSQLTPKIESEIREKITETLATPFQLSQEG